MDWESHKADWPNADASYFAPSGKHSWHIQKKGSGATVLLLHGTGASTHSWDGLFQRLSLTCKVIAIDLPGHGFTRLGTKQRSSLTHMAADIMTLCQDQKIVPNFIIGHSAGAAIALELSKSLPLSGVIGLNAALSKFGGIASWAFPMIAKFISLNPFVPSYLAGLGRNPTRVEKLMKETGSRLNDVQLSHYKALFRDRNHVEGALLMMSQWNLERLLLNLDNLDTPTLLMTGAKDGTVPPKVSRDIAVKLPAAQSLDLPDLGHLAHEEAPELICDEIIRFIKTQQTGA
jgi:magnesium chelatase accessory protein